MLDAAHAHGVVHRDIKPENLFLVGATSAAHGPRIKILDFGLARLLQNQTITAAGLALGTPSFMSPEQAAGRIRDIDGRTDLFALAATGFRVRAGRRIHEAESPVELVTKMANLPAPRLATVAPGVSAPFARVIDRGLEFKREDRYASAAAMGKDVRLAIHELETDVGARRIAKPPRLPPPVPRAAQGRKAPSGPTLELDSDVLVPQREPSPKVDASNRTRKHRSVQPWLVLLVVASVGGWLWGEQGWAVAQAQWANAREIAQARWAAVRSGLMARAIGASQDVAPVASASSASASSASASSASASSASVSSDDAAAVPADAATGPSVSGFDRTPGETTTEDGGDATTEDGEEGGDAPNDAGADAAFDVEVDAPPMGASTDSDGSADAAPSAATDSG